MSPLRILYYALWIAPVPVYVCLTVFMFRRQLQRQLPAFFSFAVYQIAAFFCNFYFFHRGASQYFYAYWTTAILSMAIAFWVLHEIFVGVFRPFSDLREFGAVLFRWAALVLTLAAALLAISSKSVPGSTRLFTSFLELTRSLEIMQCGLVLLMLLCSTYLGISLRHRIFGIALGFGVTAAVDLITVAALAALGREARIFVQVSEMVAYNIAALLWLGYMYAGEVERKPARQVASAERWNYALATALHPGGETPSLPLIEHTVERIFTQTNGKSKPPATPPRTADQ